MSEIASQGGASSEREVIVVPLEDVDPEEVSRRISDLGVAPYPPIRSKFPAENVQPPAIEQPQEGEQ